LYDACAITLAYRSACKIKLQEFAEGIRGVAMAARFAETATFDVMS